MLNTPPNTMNEQDVFDQTAFNEDLSSHQQPTAVPLTKEQIAQAAEPKPENKQKKMLKIGGIAFGAIVVALLIFGVALRMMGGGGHGGLVLNATPTPTPQTQDSEITRLIKDLKADIDRADPTVNEFPFPPITYTLYIQPKTN